jgi:hypothetical protein
MTFKRHTLDSILSPEKLEAFNQAEAERAARLGTSEVQVKLEGLRLERERALARFAELGLLTRAAERCGCGELSRSKAARNGHKCASG